MDNLNRDLTVLLHIKKYCNDIKITFDYFGTDIEKFKENSIFKNAISMAIFQIGELANHLTSEYLSSTSNEIKWNEIRGMRNRFAHGYDVMNYEVIFLTAKNDIPKLEKFIDKEIEKLNK